MTPAHDRMNLVCGGNKLSLVRTHYSRVQMRQSGKLADTALWRDGTSQTCSTVSLNSLKIFLIRSVVKIDFSNSGFEILQS